MKYNLIKNTNLNVSQICLGSMTWGEQNTESEAHEQLDYARTQGVNFIDTAEMYSVPPRAETYIGTWLKKRRNRDKIILATKVAGPGETVSHIRGGPRLNRENIRQAVENSLRRLQTDYIDLYQIH
jgi:aryl-alcohol dehydrogenase-like predicted oxidoreductase